MKYLFIVMIYTAIRLGFDVGYWVCRMAVDGTYYMIYGHQETEAEKIQKEMRMLETRSEGNSLELRKMNKLLEKLAEKQGIKKEDLDIDLDNETVLIN